MLKKWIKVTVLGEKIFDTRVERLGYCETQSKVIFSRVFIGLMLIVVLTLADDAIAVSAVNHSADTKVPLLILNDLSDLAAPDSVLREFERFRTQYKSVYTHSVYHKVGYEVFARYAGQDLIASLNYPNPDYVQVILVEADGSQVVQAFGDEIAFAEREIKFRLPSFRIPNASPSQQIFIQVLDTIESQLTLTLRPEIEFDNYKLENYFYYGLYFGVLLLLIVASLFLLWFTREISFLWYSVYLSFAVLFLLSVNGLGQAVFWPSLAYTTKYSFWATSGMILSISVFAVTFLGKDSQSGLFRTTSSFVFMGVVGTSIALIYKHHGLIDEIFFTLGGLQMLVVFSFAVVSYKQNRGSALFLILGYLVLFPALVLSILKFTGLIDSNAIVNHSVEVSFLLEALIFSAGLGNKVQRLREIEREGEREIAQTRRAYLNNLINVREQEKRDLGVLLHNSIAQLLALLRAKLVKLAKTGDPIAFDEVIELAGQSMNKIRDISHTTYPHVLSEVGLGKAVMQYAETHFDEHEVDLKCQIEDQGLNDRENLLLYRILQECINNVIRHANASRVTISLLNKDSKRLLDFSDDGDGFDTSETGFGLATIREYTQVLGGELNLVSKLNHGTLIRLTF